MKADSVKAGLMLAVAGVAVYLGYRAFKTGSGVVESVQQAATQAAADVQSFIGNNITGPIARGAAIARGEPVTSSKAWLYDDYHYTGVDPATGLLVTDGEWYGNTEALQYENAMYQKPAATSVNGAAFGVWASTAISAGAANEARKVYAATDPRRVDLRS